MIAALDTGARFGVLRRMLWADVDFANREIRLRAFTTKTLTARSFILDHTATPRGQTRIGSPTALASTLIVHLAVHR
jgi:integrase